MKLSQSLKLRNKLIEKQFADFRKMFRQAYRKVKKLLQGLGDTKLDEQRLKSAGKSIAKIYKPIGDKIESEIADDLELLCEEIVQEFEEESGQSVDDDLVSDIVAAVILGLIYDSDWTLHKATDTTVDEIIRVIIRNGLEKGHSASDIADTILRVLDPDSTNHRYIDKDGKVYSFNLSGRISAVGTTTLVHGYQKAIIDILENSDYDDPKVRWISALAPNTCELCEQRHNQIYRLSEVPLEHPNGQCELEIII